LVKTLHGWRILEDLGDLDARRDELKDIAVVLDWPTQVLGSVSHLERVLQNGGKLLNLSIKEDMSRNPALSGKGLQEEDPFGPLAIIRRLDGSHLLPERDRELVLGHEIESALRQAIVDPIQDNVLFLNVKVGWEVGKLPLLPGNNLLWGTWKELMGAVKFITI